MLRCAYRKEKNPGPSFSKVKIVVPGGVSVCVADVSKLASRKSTRGLEETVQNGSE